MLAMSSAKFISKHDGIDGRIKPSKYWCVHLLGMAYTTQRRSRMEVEICLETRTEDTMC